MALTKNLAHAEFKLGSLTNFDMLNTNMAVIKLLGGYFYLQSLIKVFFVILHIRPHQITLAKNFSIFC